METNLSCLLSMVSDALCTSDILFITETHANPVRPLPDIAGYHWFSTRRQETRSSGGVTCLITDSFSDRVSLVDSDKFAMFMWIRLSGFSLPRDIYMEVCYFLLCHLSFLFTVTQMGTLIWTSTLASSSTR